MIGESGPFGVIHAWPAVPSESQAESAEEGQDDTSDSSALDKEAVDGAAVQGKSWVLHTGYKTVQVLLCPEVKEWVRVQMNVCVAQRTGMVQVLLCPVEEGRVRVEMHVCEVHENLAGELISPVLNIMLPTHS